MGNHRMMSNDECSCLETASTHLVVYKELGMDELYAEVTILRCPICSRFWLRYFYELEAFTASGRWYLGEITALQARQLTAENARETLEALSWYFSGGSYYYGKISKSSGRIF